MDATWEAAGRMYELPACERFTLRDGLAVEAVGYYDLTAPAEMTTTAQRDPS